MADDDTRVKPRMDIYTAMLILAFIAITAACVILALDLTRYRNPASGRIEITPPSDLRVDLGS